MALAKLVTRDVLHSACINYFFAHFRQVLGVGMSGGVEISHKRFGAKLSSSSTT